MSLYTNRHIEYQTVTRMDGEAITGSSGWTAWAPDEVVALLHVGAEYGVETKGGPFGTICGWRIGDRWVARKSDEDLERERQEWLDENARRKREQLAAHRSEWIGREENLPAWLQARLRTFHERGGEEFELDGWGYELAICELAALYLASGGEDDAAINAFAREQGTSGNQHGMAKALAAEHMAGRSLAGTVSALSPISGDAFYEGHGAASDG